VCTEGATTQSTDSNYTRSGALTAKRITAERWEMGQKNSYTAGMNRMQPQSALSKQQDGTQVVSVT
jgi:hypothetical protein